MAKEPNNFWNKYSLPIIIVLVVIFILYWFFNSNNSNIEIKNESLSSEEVAGLHDSVNVGGLSFKLTDVELFKSKMLNQSEDVVPLYYLWWRYTVTNDGEEIANVYNCGMLLIDEYQYDFSEDLLGDKQNTNCTSYKVVPGASIQLWSNFQFLSWGVNPNTKITYFSQQNNGLAKFVIKGEDIKYTFDKYYK